MKYFFIVLFFVVSGVCPAQNPNDSILEVRDKLIRKANDSVLTKPEKEELVNIAFFLQNKGFLLEERNHDYSSSLEFIESAISVWVALRDTSMEANLYKYKGMLLGRLHRFHEAKITINQAIQLYTEINQPFGVAVSKFDLATVYDCENKLDSALHNAHFALEYWESVSEPERMFSIQDYLIYLYLKSGNLDEAVEIQSRNKSIAQTTELNKYSLMDFYFITFKLNEVLNNDELKNKYWELYRKLSLELDIDLNQKYSL